MQLINYEINSYCNRADGQSAESVGEKNNKKKLKISTQNSYFRAITDPLIQLNTFPHNVLHNVTPSIKKIYCFINFIKNTHNHKYINDITHNTCLK